MKAWPVDAALTDMVHTQMPYAAELGLHVVTMTNEEVLCLADWAPERKSTVAVVQTDVLARDRSA